MRAAELFRPEDDSYVKAMRQELHRIPELEFDLPKTVAAVKRELAAMGIPHTEQFGKGSVVGYLGQDSGFTIALRADMDALPLTEKTGLPYASQVPGVMHACGHDAHTAMLLCTARVLKRAEHLLSCRVLLIFQPSEEGKLSGAEMMVKNGVMDGVHMVLGLHVENFLESGTIGVCPGPSMAASHPYTIEFFGRTAHATLPQTGCDALAMAVNAYNRIYMMNAREISPLYQHVLSISCLQAGHTHNVIPDYAVMKISIRNFDMEIDAYMERRITEICQNAAAEMGGTCEISNVSKAHPIINDPEISNLVLEAAAQVVGETNLVEMPVKLSSEDFSFYLQKVPGVFFRLGTRNAEKDCVTLPHNNDFRIDEDAFLLGSETCVQFVLNNMQGVMQKETTCVD